MLANRTTWSGRFFLMLILALLCTTAVVQARTITVGRSGCDYSSVQQAINAANHGDTVLVQPGTYYGTIKMKDGITLLASDDGEVRLHSDYSPVVMADKIPMGRLSGFVLEYTGASGSSTVWLSNAGVEISDCIIRGATYSGIHIQGASEPTIWGNTIIGNDGNGLYIAENSGGIFERNIISENTASGIHVRDNATPEISGNSIRDNEENGIFSCGDSTGRFLSNEISGNGHKGIYVIENAAPFIDSNTVFSNAQEGISVVRTSSVTASNNDIYDNRWAGVFAGENAKLLLHGNMIYRNHEAVCVTSSAEAAITGNSLYENRDSGIVARDQPSVYVEANTIRDNVECGIYATGSASGDISGNQISGNGRRGIHVAGTAQPNIRGNTIFGNGREGISIVRASRFPEGAHYMEVTDNAIYDHPHAGVFLGQRSELLLRQNTIHDNFEGICVSDEVDVDIESNSIYENRDAGVEIREDAVGRFLDNAIHNNDKCGIFAWGAASGEIRDNQIELNGHAGIHLTETTAFLVADNEISHNLHEGICITGSVQRTVSGNEICANGFAGIFVGETVSAVLTDNVISGNLHEGICVAGYSLTTIRGNSISSNVFVGIRTQDSATGIIEDNTVSGNEEHGIFAIGSSGGEISGNTIRENVLYGISVQESASPVIGGNILADNGQGSITIRGQASPKIVSIVCPTTIPTEPFDTAVMIQFHDNDSDVQTARFEVLEGGLADFVLDLTQSPYAEHVVGVADGAFGIEISVPEPGSYRLQVTLLDSAGLASSPIEFAFQAFTPDAPGILGVSVPELIEIPQILDGLVQYEDSDADITQARFEILDGSLDDFTLDLTQPPYAEQMAGLAEGEFAFEIVPTIPGSYRIQVTLVDATGLESEPVEFSFEVYTPMPPAVTRITFPTSIAVSEDQNGLVRFEDAEGDIVEARLEIIEGDASTIEIDPGLSFDPEVEGETDGAFRFTVRVTQPQTVTLRLILVDAAGLESEPYEFTFDVR